MINLTNNNAVVLDNTVVINGVEVARLSDTDATKLMSIIHAMTNNTHGVSAPVSTPVAKAKKESKDFPDLGEPKATVGFCTQYKNAVRYWENGYTPDKVKYGIKKSLTEKGAVWSKEVGAFVFKTVKEADEFMKAQKNRESK